MIIKRFKIGLKRLVAGVFALLAFSSTVHAGERALADRIRDCSNETIMTVVAGAVMAGYLGGCFAASWFSEEKEAQVVAAIRANRNLKLNQVPEYKIARRIWLASLLSTAALGISSGSIALSVIQDDEYNSRAKFTAGVYGALACLTTGRTLYNVI